MGSNHSFKWKKLEIWHKCRIIYFKNLKTGSQTEIWLVWRPSWISKWLPSVEILISHNWCEIVKAWGISCTCSSEDTLSTSYFDLFFLKHYYQIFLSQKTKMVPFLVIKTENRIVLIVIESQMYNLQHGNLLKWGDAIIAHVYFKTSKIKICNYIFILMMK